MEYFLASYQQASDTPSLPPYTYNDDFNDNTLNTSFWFVAFSGDGGTLAETNQQIEITLPAGSLKALQTVDSYTYDDNSIWWEVKQVPTNHADIGTWNEISNGAELIGLFISNGNVGIYDHLDTDLGTFTYNSTTMKWFRLRELSGTMYAEYSTNGFDWTELANFTTPFVSTLCRFTIGAYNDSGSDGGQYIIDNFYGY